VASFSRPTKFVSFYTCLRLSVSFFSFFWFLQLFKVYLSFVPSFSVCLFCPTRISENRGGSHAAVFHRKKRFRVLLTADPIWDFDKRRIYCSRWNNIIHKKLKSIFAQVKSIKFRRLCANKFLFSFFREGWFADCTLSLFSFWGTIVATIFELMSAATLTSKLMHFSHFFQLQNELFLFFKLSVELFRFVFLFLT